ncbi:MAG: GGDEF and EAL domain-containing protein [Ancalomicrobiaceae bacterium]|nr:GGDEF and EAL domain-containing protein [Ancalomicrobiaceae bacterium]
MVGGTRGLPDAATTAGVAVRMHAAVTEHEVFAILAEACGATTGPMGLDGYVMALNGRALRHVASLGAHAGSAAFAAVESWLSGGPDPLPTDGDAEIALAGQRLTVGQRLVGGLIVTARPLTAADVERCFVFAPLAASAIAGLQQRRLSHLVLEALERSEEAISFYDEDEGIIFTNDAYHRVFPHYPDRLQLRGRSHLELYRMDLEAGIIDDPLARTDPEAYLAGRAHKSHLLVSHQREIQKIDARTYIYTRSRSKTGATMSRRIDITEQAATEARLRQREQDLHTLAFQDPLTGLFNRAYLRDCLGHLQLRLAEGTLAGIVVLLVDLNGFKVVNDTYGHECGDHVLKVVAARLSGSAVGGDIVVRLGGDEFIVVFERIVATQELEALADAIVALVTEPVVHGDLALKVGTSIGIARMAGRDANVGSIVSDADLAMYEAKRQKCSGYRFFQPDLRERMVERLALVDDARHALKAGEFELHYQPQYATQGGQLVGFEALARWRHPVRGLISPTLFIPIMEEYGLIETLGTWVLQTACAEARSWPGDLRVAVNVSPLQVRSSRFSLMLCETLMQSGLPPHRLELEITESVFLADEQRTRAELDNWKALGVRIALDDFGRGYSSLSYLGAFPIDKIKIDRAFLGEFDPRQPDASAGVILNAIIDLGRELGMTVTAEGVERPDQLDFLRRQQCAEVQGFLLGRPMPADQVARLLQTAGITPSAA